MKENMTGFSRIEKVGRIPLFILMIVAVIATAISPQVFAETYDVVINNGRVIDPETMLNEVLNVGVKDGKITAITKNIIQGRQTIDAAGHVVAPGFIDPHSHNVPTSFGQKLALRDGVTTPLELELGVLPVNFWYEGMKATLSR
jgi:N-acyl-D-glutamate deacylase